MKQLIEHNKKIVTTNKHTMNEIEIGVYRYKENVLWMYNHYRDMLTLICNVDVQDQEVLNRAAAATKLGMDAISDSFINTFRMTPDQYSEIKVKMTYTNQQGQSYPAPNAGVN